MKPSPPPEIQKVVALGFEVSGGFYALRAYKGLLGGRRTCGDRGRGITRWVVGETGWVVPTAASSIGQEEEKLRITVAAVAEVVSCRRSPRGGGGWALVPDLEEKLRLGVVVVKDNDGEDVYAAGAGQGELAARAREEEERKRGRRDVLHLRIRHLVESILYCIYLF
jgi:hypothetical protein